MKAEYWYYKDKKEAERLTVCYLLDDEGKALARGMAICCYLDNPSRKRGKRIARGRAYKSLMGEKTYGEVLRVSAMEIIHQCVGSVYFDKYLTKGLYSPEYAKDLLHVYLGRKELG
jgi:hypothetical protein